MEKLLENLKKAIKHYEDCVDVCAAKHIMAESILMLSRCCKEVDKECQIMFETMFDWNDDEDDEWEVGTDPTHPPTSHHHSLHTLHSHIITAKI